MKKRMLSLFAFIFAVLLIGGCGNKTADPNSTGKNTSSGSGSKSKEPASLEDGIKSSGALTELGKLVVFVTNNNKVAVDMEIEVEFYDKDGTIVGSDSETLQGVGAKADIAVEMWSTPKDFDNYKIYVDVEKTTNNSFVDKLSITHNNNGSEIAVQVTNNSEEELDYITIGVVFYKGDKVVGFDDGIEDDVKAGRSANFNIDYPYNKNYDDVNFDSYKVFVNEAYSYNW